ncbi:MAG TPA: T9SS type A sorting domain-containing protein, partial [Mariniphaga anaerophila]|nr:T9SS type A sorting domain-containing protein [Mariniphaga anaerophila]
ANGDVSVEIYSEWDGSAWKDTDKDEYIYSNTNFSEVAFPSYIEMYFMGDDFYQTFNKTITKINTSNMIDESWKLTETTTYHYSSEPSSNIDELKESTVSVFPNPAIDNVTFRWTENHEQLQLKVYLLNGAKVMEQPAYQGRAIPISHLERGVYFYKLLNEQKVIFSGKLVKQ